MSAQIYIEGPPTVPFNMTNAVILQWSDANGNVLGGSEYVAPYPANTWLTIGDSTHASIMADGVADLSVTIYLASGWVGKVYIDNIQLH
jgi:hypothetical protein